MFCFFYNFWKETEAAAHDVDLPVVVLEHLETDECVYKLSSSVKTSHGVGKIAMTQRRLFLLTEGRPGYVEITKFRDIEVRISQPMFNCFRLNCNHERLYCSHPGREDIVCSFPSAEDPGSEDQNLPQEGDVRGQSEVGV